MKTKLTWPALRKAIYEMQMDNGYSDEAGADQALAAAENDLPAIDVMMAEQWCEKCLPAELAAACAGEERGIDLEGTVRYVDLEAEAFVPGRVDAVLNYLFDRM